MALTDMVIDAATNTNFTSTQLGSNAAYVGNIINVTAGTGFTVQRVQIMSHAAGVYTCDKSLGTLGSTGGTGNLGGALASPGMAAGLAVAANLVYCKSGTYAIGSGAANTSGQKIACAVGGTTVATVSPMAFIGYHTTRTISNTDSTRTIFQAGAASFTMFDFNAKTNVWLWNIVFDGHSDTHASVRGVAMSATANGGRIMRCKFMRCGNNGINSDYTDSYISDCEFTSNGSNAFNGRGRLHRCAFYANTATPILGGASLTVYRCIVAGNTGASTDGINHRSTEQFYVGSTICYGNGRDGVRYDTGAFTTNQILIDNCILVGNGGYGISINTANTTVQLRNVASYNNTSGRSSNVAAAADLNAVTLSADPFTNAAGNDFSLNNTAGGGALLRAAGIPGAFPGISTTGYIDIGAVQHADPAAGGIMRHPGMAGGFSG